MRPRHHRAPLVVAVVCLLAAGGDALAQPGMTPVAPPAGEPASAPGPVAGEKSESLALGLSLGATVGSIALASFAEKNDSDELDLAAAAGIWFGPTVGHWYAGKAWTPGLTARFAGAGAIVLGALMLIGDCFDCTEDDNVAAGIVLMYGGAAAFVGGAVHDIATAPRSARRYNARLRARAAARWSVAPTVGRGRAGLVVGASF